MDIDHEVSRFWSCGWGGACPRETWRYRLAVQPLTDDAAVKWYGLYHREHLERARTYLRGIARGDMHAAPVPAVRSDAADGRPFAPQDVAERQRKDAAPARMEGFRRDVQLYDRGDPGFRRRIVEQMKAGLRMQAYFSVSGSVSDRSATGWILTPGC